MFFFKKKVKKGIKKTIVFKFLFKLLKKFKNNKKFEIKNNPII